MITIKRTIYLFFFLFAISLQSDCQDLHFTNNAITPTFFNPAQVGAFSGTYRLGLLYRDQWRSISGSGAFQKGALSIDSPLVWGLTKRQWVGVGATLFYDKSGEVSQTWSGMYPGVSYHIGFDKKLQNVFTIGVQYGFSNRGYSTDNYISEFDILQGISGGGGLDPDRMHIEGQGNEDFSSGYGDLNIGLMYKAKIDKYSKFEIGASLNHLLNPVIDFSNDGRRTNIGRRLNFHTQYRRATNKRMIWEPALYFSLMPGATNTQLQIRNEYLLKKKGKIVMITGLGYRLGDSAQLLLGAKYNDWLVSFSYDHGVSGLSASGIATAYELGIQRIFTIYKKPEVDPIIYCPRL